VAKARAGKVNATDPRTLGDGAAVSAAILNGDPITGADWYGYFRSVEVIAAYPVSQWVPATETELGYWSRVRTAYRTWTRTHTGDEVIPVLSSPTFEDDFEEEGFDLAADEEIVPGRDDDPADFADDYLSRTQSEINALDQVGRSELIAYAADFPADWSPWSTTAPSEFQGFGGPAGGIVLWGGYDEVEDRPYQISALAVRWSIGALFVGDPVPADLGAGAPFVADPGPTLQGVAERRTFDIREPEVGETLTNTYTRSMPWRSEPGYFAWAEDLANPDGPGWADLTGSAPVPGIIAAITAHAWALGLGLMLRR
jgi:hypothetical protein